MASDSMLQSRPQDLAFFLVSTFRTLILATLLWSGVGVISIAHADRLTPEKLLELNRIGDVAIAPDGTRIAYLVTKYDLSENKGKTSLWIQPLPKNLASRSSIKSVGFETPLIPTKPQERLSNVDGLSSLHWIERPEGDRLLYLAKTNGDEGKTQAWLLDPDAGDPLQITSLPESIGNLKPSPTGDAIAFTMDIKMDEEVKERFPKLDKTEARIIDSLMYRHWNAWHDFAYSHVHVAKLSTNGIAETPVDLMNNLKADCPVPPFGGAEQFEFSPDGKEIALTLKLVDNPAESTDTSIYLVPVSGGEMKLITANMPGYDMEPKYSPDGRFIAFHSMERGGFESDRNRIMLYDRTNRSTRELTAGLDQMTHSATWSANSKSMYFYSEVRGTDQVYSISVDSHQLTQLTDGWFDFSLVGIVPGSDFLVVKQQNILRPTELGVVDVTTRAYATMTDVNADIYANLELPRVEERYFEATDGKMIHNWVVFPPDYDAKSSKKWPMLTYCQGGPQGQVGQWFSYRWNFHAMAAQGYVVLGVNRRGLPGFGGQWNDQISGDWGGQAMQDILSATDGMTAEPTIDPKHVAAVGASFGGYTVYWLMGNGGDRFCAMIAHCGVFNLESMYGSTEELFFVNWDMGGPYWKSPELAEKYDKFSPHRYVQNWKTPLLVIHGENDFRVPITQGIEAFTAAQVQGVPSEFLYFPDEGHWITKPQNSLLWGTVFFDWLDRYCKPDQAK